MSRPIAADGTSRYSTGGQGRDQSSSGRRAAYDANQARQHGRSGDRNRQPARQAAHLPNELHTAPYLNLFFVFRTSIKTDAAAHVPV